MHNAVVNVLRLDEAAAELNRRPGASPLTASALLREGASAPVAASAESSLAQIASAPSQDAVKSPMVGTAFLRAEPGGKPFVSPGDTVKAGDMRLLSLRA